MVSARRKNPPEALAGSSSRGRRCDGVAEWSTRLAPVELRPGRPPPPARRPVGHGTARRASTRRTSRAAGHERDRAVDVRGAGPAAGFRSTRRHGRPELVAVPTTDRDGRRLARAVLTDQEGRRRRRPRPCARSSPRAHQLRRPRVVVDPSQPTARARAVDDRAPPAAGRQSRRPRRRVGGTDGLGSLVPSKSPSVEIEVDDRVVRVSNPDRVYFPETRRDQARPGRVLPRRRPRHRQRALRAAVHAAPLPEGPGRRQGAPEAAARPGRPPWVETVQLHFPRWNRTADELCVTELGAVIWAVQMSTVEFHPWNSRREDTEKPDEWRIDLDPGPAVRLRARSSGSPTSPTRCSTSSAPSATRRPAAARGCTSTSGSGPTTASRTYAAAALGVRPRGRAPRAATT